VSIGFIDHIGRVNCVAVWSETADHIRRVGYAAVWSETMYLMTERVFRKARNLVHGDIDVIKSTSLIKFYT